jgi:hypothetical protein
VADEEAGVLVLPVEEEEAEVVELLLVVLDEEDEEIVEETGVLVEELLLVVLEEEEEDAVLVELLVVEVILLLLVVVYIPRYQCQIYVDSCDTKELTVELLDSLPVTCGSGVKTAPVVLDVVEGAALVLLDTG